MTFYFDTRCLSTAPQKHKYSQIANHKKTHPFVLSCTFVPNAKPMKLLKPLLFSICCSFALVPAKAQLSNIAFGSCGSQNHPLPIFYEVVKRQPELFIFLGDNIYGDTKSMATLRRKYNKLGNKPSFKHLAKHVPIIATWDDHDYGQNDAGKEYPFKAQSKKIFLDFFKEPKNSARYDHEGIYTAYYYTENERTVQVILLDNRTFRDKLKRYNGEFDQDKRYFYKLDYAPHTDTTTTFLGEEQWAWLEAELRKPADLRIIGSGSQFGIEFNGYEAWANFPHEQKRMLELIKETRAEGVVFISGDVHYAELSKLEYPGLYPIYDLTASGLSSTWGFATPNVNRIAGPVMQNHFGRIGILWQQDDPTIMFEVWDVDGNKPIDKTIRLSDLKFEGE